MREPAALLGVDAGEPMANLHGAARYLTAQLAEFGRVDLALAAYNAGPQRVAQFHGIPPYRETRDYVARITAAVELAGTALRQAGRAAPMHAVATATALDDPAPLMTTSASSIPRFSQPPHKEPCSNGKDDAPPGR